MTLANRASLKKSELNSTSSMWAMLPPDSKYAAMSVSIASGSCGGISFHAATGGSSATKKLYRCLEMNRAVAGWSMTVSITSVPSSGPVTPRKVFSP